MNEEKKNIITIMNDQGEQVDCEVLFTFDSEETKKSYIAYTDNTEDEVGNTKVFASCYDPSGANSALTPLESEEEWQVIENILASIQEKVSNDSSAE